MSNLGKNPFAYSFGEEPRFISLMTQRDAKYKKAAEEVYNAEHLEEDELYRRAFNGTIEVPTPHISEIDGYSPAEDNSDDCNTDKPTDEPSGDDNNTDEPVVPPTDEPSGENNDETPGEDNGQETNDPETPAVTEG